MVSHSLKCLSIALLGWNVLASWFFSQSLFSTQISARVRTLALLSLPLDLMDDHTCPDEVSCVDFALVRLAAAPAMTTWHLLSAYLTQAHGRLQTNFLMLPLSACIAKTAYACVTPKFLQGQWLLASFVAQLCTTFTLPLVCSLLQMDMPPTAVLAARQHSCMLDRQVCAPVMLSANALSVCALKLSSTE